MSRYIRFRRYSVYVGRLLVPSLTNASIFVCGLYALVVIVGAGVFVPTVAVPCVIVSLILHVNV